MTTIPAPDGPRSLAAPPTELALSLAHVLALVRSRLAVTRPDVARVSGYGRTVVTERLGQLIGAGLVEEGEKGVIPRGRAPRLLSFLPDAGVILTAEIEANALTVGVTDLDGRILVTRDVPHVLTPDVEVVMAVLDEAFGAALAEAGVSAQKVWGIGLGVPFPVDYATARPIATSGWNAWDGYGLRAHLEQRFGAPTWADNDVNLMALGELRSGVARGVGDFVYVRVGRGVGGGVVSGGRLHRGAQGAAGALGHIKVVEGSRIVCRCGSTGCLQTVASGGALVAEAMALAQSGQSPYLAHRLAAKGEVELEDLAAAALEGDAEASAALERSAAYLGTAIATAVNFHNPALVLLGGPVVGLSQAYLATVRGTVLRKALPLATRDLRIEVSPLGDRAGLVGAAAMVVDELLSPGLLERWIEAGSPRVLAGEGSSALSPEA
ncbi:Sugar kinase of the NBD/HSP70 family, may contain an N-terminal HTH domain [Devosia enhydra]|uniref:Sugar kinase of the NBD/HSP70 family, may contain an N-terminal HTH domain n=1 Tax=Devosia enhydra TaxID=665118 RepID=A0A1K2HZF9_9HYPH|nr:ROK family protein [Devosia enhydra]SFZ85514.1 Sugar kinase of the NBD/HSP70 family, may contain an N-terminal HTH domain [Devosia enhydra]